MPSQEIIKKVVNDLYAATREGNKEKWVNSFASDAISHDPVGSPPMQGHEALGKFFDNIVNMFQTVGLVEDHIFIAGNAAAVKWTGTGTSKSGKQVKFEGIDVLEVNEQGKIQTAYCYWDPSQLMAQL